MALPPMTEEQKALLAKIGLTPEQFEERVIKMQEAKLGPALEVLRKAQAALRPDPREQARPQVQIESVLFDSAHFGKKR